MATKNKRLLVTLIIVLSLVLGFIFFVLIGLKQRKSELERTPAYGYAVIVDTYVGAKARDFVRYEFVVNGKVYDGHQNYMPHRQSVNIGDTCEIVYADSNPEISRLLTDDNKFLKITRRNKELKFLQE
jgi:hypothetical protein